MKKTLFMIHGMFCGAWCWEKYKVFFEDKGYECVTTTLRHHELGLNELPDPSLGTTSLLDYAKDLEEAYTDSIQDISAGGGSSKQLSTYLRDKKSL